MDDAHTPTSLRIKLKKSKTDQLGYAVDVYVGRIDSLLCPVGAGLDYMVAIGFPLTKSMFTQHVHDVLQAVGLTYTQFAGHRFRIGAATAAARAGIEDSVIRSYTGQMKQLSFP